MKQVLQNLRTGETLVEEVPAPPAGPNRLLIRTRAALAATGSGTLKVDELTSRRYPLAQAGEALVDRVAAGGEALIPLDELANVTLASFAAMTAAREARTVILAEEYSELLSR